MEPMEADEKEQQDLVESVAQQKKEEAPFRYSDPVPHPWLSIRNQPAHPRYTELLQDFKQEVS